MSTKPIPESSPDFSSPLAHAINELIATRPEIVPAPASAAAAGTPGQISWDTEHFYICTETNSWKRVAFTIF
jgi:hypothetical protein